MFERSLNLTAVSSAAYQDFQIVNHLSIDNGMLYRISTPLGRDISFNFETGIYQMQTKIKAFLEEQDHFFTFPTRCSFSLMLKEVSLVVLITNNTFFVVF